MTITSTYHLECDRCHADGGTEEVPASDDFPPAEVKLLQPQEGWRKIRQLSMDICPACIASMPLAEYLGYEDEGRRKAREEQQAWEKNREALKAVKTA
jgi:hypothetical protein